MSCLTCLLCIFLAPFALIALLALCLTSVIIIDTVLGFFRKPFISITVTDDEKESENADHK